jgi:hypothetical protein
MEANDMTNRAFRARSQEGRDVAPTSESTTPLAQAKRQAYWDRRFSLSSLVIALLAIVAAYLQYSVYPAIMANQFGETNISLHISFFTYTLDAQKCTGFNSCQIIAGLPSFDFAQLFAALFILTQVYHLVKMRRH